MATDIARLKDDMGVPFIAAIHPGWETLGGMPEDDMLYRTVYVAPGDVLTIRGRGFRANEVLALEESDRTLGGKSVWVKLQTLKATQMGYLELQVSIQQRHLAITRVDGIPLPYVIHVVRQDGSWLYPTNEVFMNEKTGSSR
ncbi:MAG: hypothetical protein HY671_03700 [Chloroflexi bacterium]|nr:hypothetical protein [Chloroflexota bacterium]